MNRNEIDPFTAGLKARIRPSLLAAMVHASEVHGRLKAAKAAAIKALPEFAEYETAKAEVARLHAIYCAEVDAMIEAARVPCVTDDERSNGPDAATREALAREDERGAGRSYDRDNSDDR